MGIKDVYILDVVKDGFLGVDKTSGKLMKGKLEDGNKYRFLLGDCKLNDLTLFTCNLSNKNFNVEISLATEFNPYYMKEVLATETKPAKTVQSFITDKLPELYLVCPIIIRASAGTTVGAKHIRSGSVTMLIVKITSVDNTPVDKSIGYPFVVHLLKGMRTHLESKFSAGTVLILNGLVVTGFSRVANRLHTLRIDCEDCNYITDNVLVGSIF